MRWRETGVNFDCTLEERRRSLITLGGLVRELTLAFCDECGCVLPSHTCMKPDSVTVSLFESSSGERGCKMRPDAIASFGSSSERGLSQPLRIRTSDLA